MTAVVAGTGVMVAGIRVVVTRLGTIVTGVGVISAVEGIIVTGVGVITVEVDVITAGVEVGFSGLGFFLQPHLLTFSATDSGLLPSVDFTILLTSDTSSTRMNMHTCTKRQ